MRFHKEGKLSLSKHKDSIILSLLVLILIISIFSRGTSERPHVLSKGKTLESPELDQFCVEFIHQIVNKRLQKGMVEADIYEVLIQENYKVLNLVGREEPLFSRVKDDNCAVVIKDKLGLRRFDIWVTKSLEHPFYYRVRKIDEPSIEG